MSRLSSFLKFTNFYIDHDKNLRYLYALRVIRDLINQLGFFFLPIYLFQVGKTWPLLDSLGITDFQRGMITIAVFFVCERGIVALTAIPIGKLIARRGYNTAILLSYILRTIGFGMLAVLDQRAYLIFPIAILEGLQGGFFWPSYFSLFSRHAHVKSMGKDLGFTQFLLQLVSVFVPAIGGYIILYFGFPVLYFFTLAFLFFSVILILHMDLETTGDSISFTEFRKWLQVPEFAKFVTSASGRYINDAVIFLWPLYVFFFLGSIDKVGFLYTFSLFIALLTVYFIGVYIDSAKSKRTFFFSGGFLTLTWLARTQYLTVWGIAIVDAVDRLLSNVYWLFYDAIIMRSVKGGQALSFFIYRELVISMVATLSWSLFGLFFWYNQGWNALFVIAGIGVLISLLLGKPKYEQT